MRSRTLREGSLGLFVILGLGLFGVLALWLRGVSLGRQSYRFVVEFQDALGVQSGAPVRYRGVRVGRLVEVAPGINGVDAQVEVLSPDLKLPRPQRIEVNQGGLIGETTIDIVPPEQPLVDAAELPPPVSSRCNSDLIICDGDRIPGTVGVSFERLTRASTRFTQAYSEPEFVETVTALLENTSRATEDIAQLARDVSDLTLLFQEELSLLTDSTIATTQTLGRTAERFGDTADRFNETAANLNRLTETTNALLLDNRSRLVTTLENFDALSGELRQAAQGLQPILQRSDRTLALVNQNLSQLEQANLTTELTSLIENATVLSENAAVASNNLRELSNAVNDPETLLLLQQTLESARSTFQNVEKITADLDDLTGDPEFRENLRRMVNGLSGLVSLSEQLERETQLAQTLSPLERKQLEAMENIEFPAEFPDEYRLR